MKYKKTTKTVAKDRVKELEEKIKNLEGRIFRPKKDNSFSFYLDMMPSFWGDYHRPSLEEEIMELGDKMEVLAKSLKVKLVKSEAQEAKWTVKKLKPTR